MYRRQIASMQIMSDMYNRVVGSLNDVEYPLLQGRIDEIDAVLQVFNIAGCLLYIES